MSRSHVTSHVMDLTRSRQFQIITDPAPQDWLSHQSPDLPNQPSNFRINLSNQLFESTFRINLCNQPSHWIGGATRLVVHRFLQIYIHRIVLLSTEVYMIQVVDLLADHLLVEAWSVLPSSTPWWRCGWKLCWTQLRTSPLCERQLHLQESQNDENDKGLGSRPVAPRPDEYVGLDLTWSDAETFAGARLESWGISGWYKCIRMMQVTRQVGHWELRLRLR